MKSPTENIKSFNKFLWFQNFGSLALSIINYSNFH